MRVVALLPVRLESTRLPGKALKDICGIPAIVHCYRRTLLSKNVDEVYVCTDSEKIKQVVESYGGKTIMTKQHINGSERIFEASKKIPSADLIINVQGDEVLVNPDHIDLLVEEMKNDDSVSYVLGVTNFNQSNQKSVFKAVLDDNKNMIYCSREDIPSRSINKSGKLLKVVFTVGFTANSLEQFVNLPVCDLENQEPNEFLRLLFFQKKIRTVFMRDAEISLDTEKDLLTIRKIMATDSLVSKYK